MEPTNKTYTSLKELINETAGSDEKEFAEAFARRSGRRQLIKHLIAMRSCKNLSQADMGKAIGCSQGRISKLESFEDDNLRLGDLRSYLHALDHDIMLVIGKKKWTIMERIKFHAFQIRACLRKIVQLAESDEQMQKGAYAAHAETIYNMARIVVESAQTLPDFQVPVQFPEVLEVDILECGSPDGDCHASGDEVHCGAA